MRFSRLTRTKHQEKGEGDIAAIILGSKTIEDFLPNKHGKGCSAAFWSTAKTLSDMCPEHDFLSLETTEFNVFEHFLLYRFWYKILQQAYERRLSVELYRDMLAKKQACMMTFDKVEDLVRRKMRQRQELVAELVREIPRETFFFKEPFPIGSEQLSQENVDYNLRERNRLLTYVEEQFSGVDVIADEMVSFFDRLLEGECMVRIGKMYQKEHVDATIVRNLLH